MKIATICQLTLDEIVEKYLKHEDDSLYVWGGEIGFGYYDHRFWNFYENFRDDLFREHFLDEIGIAGGSPGNSGPAGRALVVARKNFWNSLSDDRRAEVIACYKLSRTLLYACHSQKKRKAAQTLSATEHGRFVLSLIQKRDDHQIHDCVKSIIAEVLA